MALPLTKPLIVFLPNTLKTAFVFVLYFLLIFAIFCKSLGLSTYFNRERVSATDVLDLIVSIFLNALRINLLFKLLEIVFVAFCTEEILEKSTFFSLLKSIAFDSLDTIVSTKEFERYFIFFATFTIEADIFSGVVAPMVKN